MMMSTGNPSRILCANLSELVKKTLLTFCEINVTFASRLEIRGSVHVQADGDDVAAFLLDEKCVRPGGVNVQCSKDSGQSRFWGEQPNEVSSGGNNTARYSGVQLSGSRPLDWRPKRRKQVPQHRDAVYTKTDTNIDAFEQHALPGDGEQKDGANLTDIAYSNQLQPAGLEANWNWNADNNDIHQEEIYVDHVSLKSEGLFCDTVIPTITPANNRRSSMNSTPPADKTSSDIIDNEVAVDSASESSQPSQIKSEPVDNEYAFSSASNVSLSVSLQQDTTHSADSLPVAYASTANTLPLESSADKLYSCELCSERFHTPLRLKVHMSRWHRQVPATTGITGEIGGDVRCLVCQSTFTTSDAFAAHANSCHFPCRLCSKFFSTKQARDAHFRADHQHVRYTCPVCCVRFKTKDGFRCHMNSQHNRSKLYDCAVCQRRFYTRQALYSHKKLNHCTPASGPLQT